MRRKKVHIDHNSEFELDLAPLLAVMVKLVPVLLISSAFVQLMVIETEIPQVVQKAMDRQDQLPEDQKPLIRLEVSHKGGIKIVVTEKGVSKSETVPNKGDDFDFPTLHAKLQAVKKSYPEVFKIDLKPDADVIYDEIVKTMDEARKSRDSQKFPVFDPQQNKTVETDYMFPEVVFANTLEG